MFLHQNRIDLQILTSKEQTNRLLATKCEDNTMPGHSRNIFNLFISFCEQLFVTLHSQNEKPLFEARVKTLTG